MKKNPFGKEGDFITAPNITRLFSEIIAIWIITFWKSIGSPKKFNLLEKLDLEEYFITSKATKIKDTKDELKIIVKKRVINFYYRTI